MKLEPVIREIVSERIAKVLPMGHCDIVQDLGLKLSVKVTCLIIGLPVEDGDYLAGVVNRFFVREPGIRGMAPDAQAAAEEIREYLHKAIVERRKRGSDRGDSARRLPPLQDRRDTALGRRARGAPHDAGRGRHRDAPESRGRGAFYSSTATPPSARNSSPIRA